MGTLVFQANLGGSVNLIGPNTASTVNFTLPSADGTNGQALVTNGSGTLSFSSFVSSAAGSNTQVQFNSGGAFAGSANLTFDGTTLTAAGLSGPLNGTVGATTPNTGAFTTLSASSTITFSGGTANGVAYLNGSKVVTTGSALTFDGTTLSATSGGSTPALRVFGASTSQGQLQFGSVNGYLIQGGADYLGINFNTNNATRYTITDTGVSTWYVGGSRSMDLTSTGLGIGTSSPDVRLSVEGDIRIRTGGLLRINNPANNASSGVYTNSSNAYVIQTGGYDRATIDSSGNLGLGVTPSAWFSGKKAIEIGYSGCGIWSYASNNTSLTCNSYNNGTNWIYSTSSNASYLQQDTGAFKFFNAPSGTAGNAISFTQALTLDASGNLLVGTTSGTGNGERIYAVTDTFVPFAGRHSSTSAGKFWFFGPNSGNNYVVQNQGSVGVYITDGGTSWTSTSDERVKDIIEPISNATNKISGLRAVIGKFKNDVEGTRRSFLIAQDVQKVLPEAVNVQDDEQGTLGLSYTDMVPLLVAAIKEQQAQIESLTQRLAQAGI